MLPLSGVVLRGLLAAENEELALDCDRSDSVGPDV